MYNVNNPEEIINGAKPNLSEVGPFVYREYREKENINSSEDGCTIKADQYKWYDFDMTKTKEMCPECSAASETTITIINAAYVGALQLIRDGFSK